MATKKKKLITNVKEVPVTYGQLNAIKKHISYTSSSLRQEMKSLLKRMDSLDSRMDSLEQKMESRFNLMNARFDQILSEIHQIKAQTEEQNARNKVVMDSQALVQFKYENLDQRLHSTEKTLNEIK